MKLFVEGFEVMFQLDEKGKDDCAIRPRIDGELVVFPELLMVVDFSIGNGSVFVLGSGWAEGLLAFCRKVIDGQPVEADDAGRVEVEDGMVRPAWFYTLKSC